MIAAVRLILIALCAGLIAANAAAQASQKRFRQADYETYFTPGRYLTESPEFGSHGDLEISEVKAVTVGGVRTLHQQVRTLDVSANYDTLSKLPNYKIQESALLRLAWDSSLGAYVYEFTPADFDDDHSQVWESKDTDIRVSPGDISRGQLQAFYRAADKRAGRDVEAMRAAHRASRLGKWSHTCAYLNQQAYEVICAFRNLQTGDSFTFLYKRADRLS